MTHTGEEKPFSLSSVLEAEYVALHGRLPYTTAATESDRLAVLYGHVHNLPQKRTALCFSGGGIRSATFALGVLQGLARLSLLKQFDYLIELLTKKLLRIFCHSAPLFMYFVTFVTRFISTPTVSRI